MDPRVTDSLTRSIASTEANGPQNGNYDPAASTDYVTERLGQYNETPNQTFLDAINSLQQETDVYTNEQLQNRAGTARNFAKKAFEIATPVAIGIAANRTVDAAGLAGPLGAAAAGALIGGGMAAYETTKVKADTGEGAAEFYQRNVKSSETSRFGWLAKIKRGGNFFSRNAIEGSFKVKERAEILDQTLRVNQIEVDDNGVVNPGQLYAKLETMLNTTDQTPDKSQYKEFIKTLYIQDKLSNFSENLSEKKRKAMVDIMAMASLVAETNPALAGGQYLAEALEEARQEVEASINNMKIGFIAGKATERAIKSLLYTASLERLAETGSWLLSQAGERISALMEGNLGDLAEGLRNGIEADATQLDSLQEEKDRLLEMQRSWQGMDSRIDSAGQLADAQEQLQRLQELKASGGGVSIDAAEVVSNGKANFFEGLGENYLDIPERAARIEAADELYNALQNDSNRQAVEQLSSQLSQALGTEVDNVEVVRGLLTSAPYDVTGQTLEGFPGRYESFDQMLQMALSDANGTENTRAFEILQERVKAGMGAPGQYEGTHQAWRDFAASLWDQSGVSEVPADIDQQIANLQKQVETFTDMSPELRAQRLADIDKMMAELETRMETNSDALAKLPTENLKALSLISGGIANVLAAFGIALPFMSEFGPRVTFGEKGQYQQPQQQNNNVPPVTPAPTVPANAPAAPAPVTAPIAPYNAPDSQPANIVPYWDSSAPNVTISMPQSQPAGYFSGTNPGVNTFQPPLPTVTIERPALAGNPMGQASYPTALPDLQQSQVRGYLPKPQDDNQTGNAASDGSNSANQNGSPTGSNSSTEDLTQLETEALNARIDGYKNRFSGLSTSLRQHLANKLTSGPSGNPIDLESLNKAIQTDNGPLLKMVLEEMRDLSAQEQQQRTNNPFASTDQMYLDELEALVREQQRRVQNPVNQAA